ncbi:MAG: histone deacetylase family protein [Marinibacterium sp.]|nr:histone deacetylase family protein [Marinibacterium sp.]
MTTALITHPDGLLHQTPRRCAERVARLDEVLRALEDLPLARHPAPMATPDQIALLHDRAYVDHIQSAIPETGFTPLDADREDETALSATSLGGVMRAVGAARLGVDLVMTGAVGNAFVAMRPPGHHALRDQAMGFCVFGNVALAARHALDHHGAARVAVVDFDVHHGNGTESLLWDDPRCLFVSSHQAPLWPGSGCAEDRGPHDSVLNVPLPPGSAGAEMRQAYIDLVFPRLRAFDPDLVLISAGFDGHRDDPLAELNWLADDFDWLTRNLCAIARAACGGRVVSVLEGGYHLDALATSARAHVMAMLRAFD